MAKTKPIGVRFNNDLLKTTGLTPQKALNIYEKSYLDLLKKEANYKLGNAVDIKSYIKPEIIANESDPKEGSMAFFNKYGCMKYSEIKKIIR